MTIEFSEEDRIKILLWCDRHCCLCGKACGTNIVIHHIEQEGEDLSHIKNAIPLCLDCHGKIKTYNPEHPVGTAYRIREIKARRDQIYEKYTRHLVPPIHFEITQIVRNDPRFPPRNLPDVGFNLSHLGDSLPVKVKVEAKTILGGKDLGLIEGKYGYYSGKALWNLNPRTLIFGHFNVPEECADSTEDLKIEVRITIIDQYDRDHSYLPQCWTYVRKENYWFLEPRSFTEWA
jgi:hypothetical protein